MKIPQSLRYWFKLHFFVDMLFALPLMIAPIWTLHLLGFQNIDPITTRLVAAALFGIGGVSLLANKAGDETYKTLLNLKIIWSLTAILGMLISLEQAPKTIWLLIATFAVFSSAWIYYRKELNKHSL